MMNTPLVLMRGRPGPTASTSVAARVSGEGDLSRVIVAPRALLAGVLAEHKRPGNRVGSGPLEKVTGVGFEPATFGL
jgi:hypothetical protein